MQMPLQWCGYPQVAQDSHFLRLFVKTDLLLLAVVAIILQYIRWRLKWWSFGLLVYFVWEVFGRLCCPFDVQDVVCVSGCWSWLWEWYVFVGVTFFWSGVTVAMVWLLDGDEGFAELKRRREMGWRWLFVEECWQVGCWRAAWMRIFSARWSGSLQLKFAVVSEEGFGDVATGILSRGLWTPYPLSHLFKDCQLIISTFCFVFLLGIVWVCNSFQLDNCRGMTKFCYCCFHDNEFEPSVITWSGSWVWAFTILVP